MSHRVLAGPVSSHRGRPRILIFIGPLFLFAGSLLLWQLVLQPLQLLWRSQSWIATECTILSSEAERKELSKSSNYHPKISYSYPVNGVEQTSSRYDFFEVSGGQSWAENVAAAYPVGSQHLCFYDPARPQEAVLVRGFTDAGFWFRPLIAAVFIAVGGFLVRFGLSASPAASAGESFGSLQSSDPELAATHSDSAPKPTAFSSSRTAVPLSARDPNNRPKPLPKLNAEPSPYSARATWENYAGPQQLAPTITRTGAVIGTGLAALFWNGLISFFIWGIIDDGFWLMAIFLVPFVLVGLGLIGGFFYSLLALFNPQVKIALSEGAPETGETIDIAWEVSGNLSRIREFRIVAVGEEQATYTRGTRTVTDKHPFQSLEVCCFTTPEEIRFGTASLQIPLDTMHTHAGNRNKISWSLQVHGKIPWFPDIREQYEFCVLPRGAR